MLNKDTLLAYADKHKIHWFEIFNSKGKRIYYFSTKEAHNVAIDDLKEFVNTLDEGTYEIQAKRNMTDPDEKNITWDFRIGEAQLQGTKREVVVRGLSEEEIEARIEKRLAERKKIEDLEEREELIKEQLQKFETIAGQAGVILEKVITTYIIPRFAPVINGILNPQMQTANLQGTMSQEMNLTQEQEQTLNEAEEILLKRFTPEQILSVAKEIDKNPAILDFFIKK